MPLDPMIANPTPIKINDPMEQYGAYLKNAFLMDEIDTPCRLLPRRPCSSRR